MPPMLQSPKPQRSLRPYTPLTVSLVWGQAEHPKGTLHEWPSAGGLQGLHVSTALQRELPDPAVLPLLVTDLHRLMNTLLCCFTPLISTSVVSMGPTSQVKKAGVMRAFSSAAHLV